VDFVILVKNVCPIKVNRVFNACLRLLNVSGGEQGVRRGVVAVPIAYWCQTCVGAGKRVIIPVSELHRFQRPLPQKSLCLLFW